MAAVASTIDEPQKRVDRLVIQVVACPFVLRVRGNRAQARKCVSCERHTIGPYFDQAVALPTGRSMSLCNKGQVVLRQGFRWWRMWE